MADYQKPWAPTTLSPQDELAFQQQWAMDPRIRQWRKSFEARFGELPSQDDQQYDYRGAVMNGVFPSPYANDGGFPHWGSVAETPQGRAIELKAPDHATRWMQGYMEKFGSDPNNTPYEQMTAEQRDFVRNAYSQQNMRGLLATGEGQ